MYYCDFQAHPDPDGPCARRGSRTHWCHRPSVRLSVVFLFSLIFHIASPLWHTLIHSYAQVPHPWELGHPGADDPRP
jgi:hypothetical protein